MEQWDTTASEL